jgi:hypothetical protein
MTKNFVFIGTFHDFLKDPRKQGPVRGCQIVYFNTQNTNLGIFWRAFEWEMLVYYMTVWNILMRFGIFFPFGLVCGHLVHFPALVCLNQEKSGNPGHVS